MIQMCRASPSDSGALRLPLELITALTADDTPGKRVLFMVLPGILFNIAFISVLLKYDLHTFKCLLADDCFVMIFRIVTINLAVIVMPLKAAVSIGFLKCGGTVVFLIHKNPFDCRT